MSGTLDVYLGIANRRDTNPQHWILILCAPDTTRGTYYHVKGGTTRGVPYESKVEANKRLDFHGLESATKIGSISEADQGKILAAAKAVPEQRCQTYVVRILEKLEAKGLVPEGRWEHWDSVVEPAPWGIWGKYT